MAAIAFAVAVNLLLETPGIESPKAIVNQLGLDKAVWSDLLIIAGTVIAAPIGEELALSGLVFRGVFDALGRRRAGGEQGGGTRPAAAYVVPFVIAAALATAVFTVLHANPAVGQNVFLACLGLVACVVYWLTGSLDSSVLVHSVVNSIGLGFALFAATDVGSAWHAIVIVAAPPIVLALMVPVRRFVGVVKR